MLANAVVTIARDQRHRGRGDGDGRPEDRRHHGGDGHESGQWLQPSARPDRHDHGAGRDSDSAGDATAVISPGVVTSIAVDEPGFGFTAPAVAITGGGDPSARRRRRRAAASTTLTVTGGSGYAVQPIVEFASQPPLPRGGTQATGTATMDANGVVTSVNVVNPGSGYTSAPTVTIWDGDLNLPAPTPATVWRRSASARST